MTAVNLMSNMIPGSDGGSITVEQAVMLGYLQYNPVTDRMESSKPLSTTIHSLFFGDVHSMSSSYTNVVWTNRETMVNYQAAGTAMGPHAEENGQWVSNQPSTRYYFEYEERDVAGAVGDGSVVFDYNFFQYSVPANTSNWGHSWYAGEAYTGQLSYKITTIPDDRLIVNRLYDVDVQPGDFVTKIFETPVDYYQGSYIHFELLKEDGTYMKLWSNAAEDRFWIRVHFRGFTDKMIPYEEQLSNLELAMSQELDTEKFLQDTNGEFILDIAGEFINPSIGEGGRIGDQTWLQASANRNAAPESGGFVAEWGATNTIYGTAGHGIHTETGGQITFDNIGEYIVDLKMGVFNFTDGPYDAVSMSPSVQVKTVNTLTQLRGGWWNSPLSPDTYSHGLNGIYYVKVTVPGQYWIPHFFSNTSDFQLADDSTIKIERIA